MALATNMESKARVQYIINLQRMDGHPILILNFDLLALSSLNTVGTGKLIVTPPSPSRS
jgi:hypothetical protein